MVPLGRTGLVVEATRKADVALSAFTQADAALECARARHLGVARLLRQRVQRGAQIRTQAADDVAELFAATDYLTRWELTPARLRPLLNSLPYLPLSADDLANAVVADAWPGQPDWADLDPSARQRVVLRSLMRAEDFPWLDSEQPPVVADVAAAKDRLVHVVTIRRAQTAWKAESSAPQEGMLRELATAAGYTPTTGTRPVADPADLEPGTFCPRERKLGPAGSLGKADHVLRLGPAGDGRLLLVEAKFSSSAINSVKRLGHECENKLRRWKEYFGDDAHIVVLFGGTTTAERVLSLQALGAHFVFDHDTDAFAAWLAAGLGAMPAAGPTTPC